jgi:hypothetical protein
MTAGHDEVRGLGPDHLSALVGAVDQTGLPNPRLNRFAIKSLFTLALLIPTFDD